MTEAEWLACQKPQKLLAFLGSKAGSRKGRLFACACCRRVWHLLVDRRSRSAVEVNERFADGRANQRALARAQREAWDAFNNPRKDCEDVAKIELHDSAVRGALWGVMAALRQDPTPMSQSSEGLIPSEAWVAACARGVGNWQWRGNPKERRAQSALLRDIFGNPFRPARIESSWLRWNDGTVPKIAQGIYDERVFDRMPILADALMDAGCDDESILSHCREPGPHVRGCWVVDLILGKQ
jgi:hypothetical protein